MRPQEISNDPLWEVKLEMLKDHMYCYKGQTIDEIVLAPDSETAIDKVLKVNYMNSTMIGEKVRVLGTRLWEESYGEKI